MTREPHQRAGRMPIGLRLPPGHFARGGVRCAGAEFGRAYAAHDFSLRSRMGGIVVPFSVSRQVRADSACGHASPTRSRNSATGMMPAS